MKKLLIAILALGLLSCEKDLGGVEDGPINIPTSTTLSGNINTTTTLTADKVWTLKGYVYVTDGAKLIIQPGTTIVSDIAEKGALCIERGAQIIAEGTVTKPIIFTSGRAVGEKSPGDWGGIVILGRAKTNRTSEPTIEGGIGRPFGGTNDLDNSGILRYVRIEYAGIAAMPNSEINALTLGGVGSGTIIEYVQTIYANDDAFEFFGGTVSPRNLYAFATADDDYDFDFGYNGTVTNSVSKRDPQFVDNGDAGNGVECDNDGTGSSAQPFTHPKLSGMILIGPFDVSSLSNHNLGLRWRRATQFTITNSKILGYQKGSFSIESNETAQSYRDGVSKFQNNEVQSFDPLLNFKSTSTVFTALQMKEKSLSEGNLEKNYTRAELEILSKPTWTNGWTRFPSRGN
jgi:hypothetical protein